MDSLTRILLWMGFSIVLAFATFLVGLNLNVDEEPQMRLLESQIGDRALGIIHTETGGQIIVLTTRDCIDDKITVLFECHDNWIALPIFFEE